MTRLFKGFEWIYFICCVAFCVYSFIDKEYIVGIIFTILTIAATINTIRLNLKDKNR